MDDAPGCGGLQRLLEEYYQLTVAFSMDRMCMVQGDGVGNGEVERSGY